ncbi:sensor histidine kinase [Flavobacterium sp. N1736]|uniref:sensor histidine kinase n=1 Tax=Flavobacterium sp. N1736 TaxID=2986823 RepID=UPI0022257DE8|nr:histidine kinase [Flavobacterium sp. N1736]
MVIFLKRFYLLLFLLVSFGLQAQTENNKALITASVYNSHSSLIFNTVVSTFVKNTIIAINQKQDMQFYIVIVCLSLLLLITGLLFQTYKSLTAQRLLNSKQEEVNSQKIDSILKEQELNLIKAWIDGQEKERELISQEIYNTIGRNLAAIKLQLNHLNNSNLKNITKINQQLEETYKQVRNLSNTLVPKKFSPTKFSEVLDSYLINLSAASQLNISFLAYPKKEIDTIDESIQVEVFKIVHDLLNNTIKHAKASQIEIQLNLVENDLTFLFKDNGLNFNAANYIQGISLLNLESRINKLRGSLIIDSKLKTGTLINIEIPTSLVTIDSKSKFTVKGINLKSQLDELKSRF